MTHAERMHVYDDLVLLCYLLCCVVARRTVRVAARLQQLRVSEHNVSAVCTSVALLQLKNANCAC